MSDQQNKKRESKRRTLKTLLGGTGAVAGASALPDQWSKPIISSVVLPAHAGTSPGRPCGDYSFNEVIVIEGREVGIEMEGPVNGETSVELILSYDDESGEAQTLDQTFELTALLEGLSFEVPTEAGTQNESADASEVESITNVVANFDGCEIQWLD